MLGGGDNTSGDRNDSIFKCLGNGAGSGSWAYHMSLLEQSLNKGNLMAKRTLDVTQTYHQAMLLPHPE